MPTEPPAHCEVDECDCPAERWIWEEDLGGWIAACDTHSFECDACERAFLIEPGWDAEAEAAAAFTPEELTDRAVVCDDCWLVMRAQMPELDGRYPGPPS